MTGARLVNQCLPSPLGLPPAIGRISAVANSTLMVEDAQSGGECCRQREDLQELERLKDRADGRLDPCVAWHCRHLLCISSVCGWSPWFRLSQRPFFFTGAVPFDAWVLRRNHRPLPMRPPSPPLPPLPPPSTTRPFSIERGNKLKEGVAE